MAVNIGYDFVQITNLSACYRLKDEIMRYNYTAFKVGSLNFLKLFSLAKQKLNTKIGVNHPPTHQNKLFDQTWTLSKVKTKYKTLG